MRKPIHLPGWLGLMLFSVEALSQTCPRIVNCPQSTPTLCDYTTNDSLLWNVAPFTYSNSLGTADAHEAPLDLNIKAIGCNGGGVTYISYILYLDLDGDELQETVIMSGAPPPAGRVLANNSFNPGYAGGDTVRFDRRAVPDSLHYRFALEIAWSGDTTIGYVRYCTDSGPFDYVPVILPEGRHRIEWRIVQDGETRYCDRNFKIKDCDKPVVACKPSIAVYLDASEQATLHLSHAFLNVSDNITPVNQVEMGIRHLGAGFGFPEHQDTVMFNCETDEDQVVEVWARDLVGNLEYCTATVLVYDTAGYCPFVPFPSVCAYNYANNDPLAGVDFTLSYTPVGQPMVHTTLTKSNNFCAQLSTLPPANFFQLGARKDTLPLNGVTTFDLVLISKHILATQPFDAPWKITAADVNMSNSVTTFDIVELRKLILGVRNDFPNNVPSWRFFVDTCSNPGAPFFSFCPSTYNLPLMSLSNYAPAMHFKGVKMGDVNGSAANVDSLEAGATGRGTPLLLEMQERSLNAGEWYEMSLNVADLETIDGWQLPLYFDPELIAIESVQAPGDGSNWTIKPEGLLLFSYAEQAASNWLPGDALLHIRCKALKNTGTDACFSVKPYAHLQAEAYTSEGSIRPLTLRFGPENPGSAQMVFPARPNPTTGDCTIPLHVDQGTAARLVLYNQAGQLVYQHYGMLYPGSQRLVIPATAMSAPGMYCWKLELNDGLYNGRIIRQ